MNPNQRPSFGSTSPMVGGPMVASQMQSGVPGMGQQGTQSPGFVPNMQAQPLPGQLPQGGGIPPSILPQPGMAQSPALPPGVPQKNQQPAIPKSEVQLIIEALSNHLKAKADMEKYRHEMIAHAIGLPPKGQDGQSH